MNNNQYKTGAIIFRSNYNTSDFEKTTTTIVAAGVASAINTGRPRLFTAAITINDADNRSSIFKTTAIISQQRRPLH